VRLSPGDLEQVWSQFDQEVGPGRRSGDHASSVEGEG
jgi:hypothetical protein